MRRKPNGLRLKRILQGCGTVTYRCDHRGFIDVVDRTAILFDIDPHVDYVSEPAFEVAHPLQTMGHRPFGKLEESLVQGPNGAVTTRAVFSRNGRPFFTGYQVASSSKGKEMSWGTYAPTLPWDHPAEDGHRMVIMRVKTVGGKIPPRGLRDIEKKEEFCAQFWVYGRLEDRLIADQPGSESVIC